MDRKRIIVLTLWCALALGCTGIDLEAERQAVLNADRAFAAANVSGGVEAWVNAFAKDGTMYPSAGSATGPEELRRVMAPQFEVDGINLSWEPTTAVVSASADYAYTIGKWRLENTNPLSPIGLAGTGNYVMIWRKESDGKWKVVVNIGNLDLPPDMQEGRGDQG